MVVSTDRICKIIAKALGVEENKVTLDASSSELSEWDSLGHISILMKLEEELGPEFKESEGLASAVSVKEIIACING